MYINRIFKFIKYLFLCLVILFALVLTGINLPLSQKFITENVNLYFLKKNLPVQVDKLTLLLNGRISLIRPRIITDPGDTIVFSEQIRISMRTIPLLFREVNINSVVIRDAVVNITTDTTTGSLDLISIFSQGTRKSQENDRSAETRKIEKKWNININEASLKNIRFCYKDAFNGIQVNQAIGQLNIRFDRFSLTNKQLHAGYLDMEKVHGSVVLGSSVHKRNHSDHPVSPWKFNLTQSNFKDILFFLHQPDENQQIVFSLGKGDISDAVYEPAGKRISVTNLLLQDPGVILFSSHGQIKSESGSENSPGISFPGLWDISGNKIEITNGAFHTSSYQGDQSYPEELYTGASALKDDEALLQIKTLSTSIKDFVLSNREYGFTINRLSFLQENGFQLVKGEMDLRSNYGHNTTLKGNFRTTFSKLNLEIETRNDSATLIRSYNEIPFSINIDDTEISATDILALFPDLKNQSLLNLQKNLKLGINCNMSGAADSLNIKILSMNAASGVNLSVSGNITDITQPLSAVCSFTLKTGMITRSIINDMFQLTGTFVDLPDFEPVIIEGTITDSLISPDFSLTVLSQSGNIMMDGAIDFSEKNYALKMKYSGLELGKLAEIRDMERLSGNLELDGRGFNPRSMKIDAYVTIDSAGYRGYNYHDIIIKLSGNQGNYQYKINSADISFLSDLSGGIDLKDSLFKADISGNIYLDAGKLNLYKSIAARGIVRAELVHIPGDMNAYISLNKLVLNKNNDSEDLDNLFLSLQVTDNLITGKIESDFLKADVHCTGSASDIKKVFTEGRIRGIPVVDSVMENKIPYVSALPQMSFSLESTYDPVIGLLLNDTVFGYNKAILSLVKDTAGNARGEISMDKFNLGKSYGFNTFVQIESLPDRNSLLIRADSIRYNNISLADPRIDMTVTDDTSTYRLKAADRNDHLIYDMAGTAFRSGRKIMLRSAQPGWIINGFSWNMSPGEFLILEPQNNDFVANLHWKNYQRTIDIYGRKSQTIYFDLSNVGFNMLVIPGMNTFGYDGEFTGKVSYQIQDRNEIGVQMDIREMKMAETLLGNLKFTGNYYSDTLGNIESDINTTLNDTSSLNLYLRSRENGSQKSLHTDFSGVPLHLFESIVRKYISGLRGVVTGELALMYDGNNPRLDGKVQMNKATLKVVPLNALFYLSDDIIKLENNQLRFVQFTVMDSLKKQLTLNGSVNLDDPRNITADLQVTSDRLQVMNTTEKDNSTFNGTVFVNSDLKITGPVQKPSIDGNILLAEGTVINYRYNEGPGSTETEKTITFASLTQDQSARNVGSVALNPIPHTPNIEALIEIDPKSLFSFQITRGYDISARITGGGFLNYSLLPNKVIYLNGTYEIKQGNAELKIPGWPRKDFIITSGSYLKWDGALDDPELNLETTSKVRGSYLNPVDNKNREVDFMVYMKLANRLSQLDIVFDVRSEDQYITSVLNTLSADERMKQAINLLIFNSIQLPNITSSSDYLTDQINAFWESQLNQLTRSTIKNVEVSVGIDTYKEGGSQQEYTSFTYEVKKEMFKKRGSVLVSGRMNDNSPAGSQNDNVIENFIFEYALDSSRNKYFKVYRQQNYEDILEGEVIKSGVGFIYRKNYNKLNDMWRRQKKTKKQQKSPGN